MASLEIALFGGFQVRAGAQAIEVPGRKERALLAYLAMPPGESRSRDKLAGLLWSDRGDNQARDSLKQAVFRLRKSFDSVKPQPIRADRESVTLDSGGVAVDAAEFERLIGEGTPEAVARATALYRGDLLDGLDVRDPAFDEWLLLERQRLRDLAREALAKLLERHLAGGAHDDAGAAARRLLMLDPLREVAHRALMRIYAAQGQTALALKQYQLCRDALQRELGVRPEAETERLCQSIQEKRAAARRTADQAPAAQVSTESSSPGNAPPQQLAEPALAVKPFEAASADPDQASLADWITNGILVALTRLPGLALIGDESPSLVKSKQMTVQELSRRFDVRYVLKGGIRKYGNRIRVDAELIEVSTGQYLWAEQIDRDLPDFGDLFAIQDDITEQIATALDVKLLHGEAGRIVRKSLRNPAACENLYRGEQQLWCSTTRMEFREAQRLFEEIIRLEPAASVGYAQAALAYWSEACSGLSDAPSRSLERATALAREALDREDVTGYPHLILAHVHLSRREYDDAAAEASRAVLARPSCPTAYSLKAAVLHYLGRPAEAIEFAQYAVRLTPVHPPMYPAILASAYHGAERHEEAIAAAKAAIELDDRHVEPYLVLAASDVGSGRAEEAHRAAEKVLKLKPGFRLAEYAVSQPYKDQKRLNRLLDQLRSAGLA